MKQKKYLVFCTSTADLTAYVTARNKEEAIEKTERGEWDDISEDNSIGDFRVEDAKEVKP